VAQEGDTRPTIVFLHGTRLTGAQWAVQVAALSDEYRCLTPDLPGHGSAAAQAFTIDGAAERVAGLAISGATAEPVPPRSIFYRGLAAIFSTIPEAALDAVNRWFFGWRYRPDIHEPILADGFFFAGGAVAVRSLIGERFKPRLAAYPGPSLLLNGEYDLFFRPTERSFAAVAADPRRILIRGATHLTNLDRPEAFTAAIRAFAQRVAQG
jgi:pimeloyl-ACP methyl ester carboxylesterase